MNEIFHYLYFKNLLKNWEKYVFCGGKLNFEHIGNPALTAEPFGIRKGPEYLYQLFDILPKQTTCEMKALHVIQVYIQQ